MCLFRKGHQIIVCKASPSRHTGSWVNLNQYAITLLWGIVSMYVRFRTMCRCYLSGCKLLKVLLNYSLIWWELILQTTVDQPGGCRWPGANIWRQVISNNYSDSTVTIRRSEIGRSRAQRFLCNYGLVVSHPHWCVTQMMHNSPGIIFKYRPFQSPLAVGNLPNVTVWAVQGIAKDAFGNFPWSLENPLQEPKCIARYSEFIAPVGTPNLYLDMHQSHRGWTLVGGRHTAESPATTSPWLCNSLLEIIYDRALCMTALSKCRDHSVHALSQWETTL